MADPNDITTDLNALHSAIQAQIATAFPSFRTVEFYRDDESEEIATPACLLEMDEFEDGDVDPGNGQVCLSLRFSARLLFSRQDDASGPIQARLAGSALAAFVNKNRFGGGVSPAVIISGMTDEFRPAVSGRWAIWRLEWVHREAFFGSSVWAPGPIPQAIYIGMAPKIGADHVADYEKVWPQ